MLIQGKPSEIQEASAERTIKQLKANSKVKTRSPSASSVQSARSNLSHRSPSSTSHLSSLGAGSDAPSRAANIAADTRTVSSQTVNSSLVPCDACTKVQSSLRGVSDTLVELCQSQGLPSSLVCFLDAVDGTLGVGRLSATDLAQWAEEQTRDLGRVGKHLAKMRATVQPLRESLIALEAARDELRARLERAEEQLEREAAERRADVQKLELRLQEAQSQRQEAVNRQKGEQEELTRSVASLEERNSKLQEQLGLQLENVRILESIRDGLTQELKARQVDQDAFRELEERNKMLETQFSANQVLLDKECAKYQSACRQQESMQVKQKALLEQVDILDQECTELQKQLEEGQEGKEELQKKLAQMSEEKNELKAQLKQQKGQMAELQKQKQGLESRVEELQGSVTQLQEEMQELVQRVRLLVAFPELSPAGNAQPQSTGDVLKDMEQQLKANCVRIRVLEQENATLCSSLGKLKERAQLRDLRVISPQQMGLLSKPRGNAGNPGTM
ncbi:coiled-coil domain-containing protein 157 [Megalops cyprinoides]|uniref:coiled-coil domain-containing protein 157 n=1 Tax=Megalops cyprinoides TaxID=118141 RepID=UPI0018645BA4|nr:coiled-coil domain-containing protein 157 [Megalops cyprinoides]